jgi:hypothetical protein
MPEITGTHQDLVVDFYIYIYSWSGMELDDEHLRSESCAFLGGQEGKLSWSWSWRGYSM